MVVSSAKRKERSYNAQKLSLSPGIADRVFNPAYLCVCIKGRAAIAYTNPEKCGGPRNSIH